MGSNSKEHWKGALLGLLFFVSGLVATYFMAGSMIYGYIASTNWVEVPAKIHDVSLTSSTSSDSTTTYAVIGSYSYDFDGNRYQNNRISLNLGRDSSRKYWQKLERSLQADQKSNEALATVNPNDPTEAILDRSLRWQSILIGFMCFVGFCGVGIGFMWSSLSQLLKKNDKKERLRNNENGIHSNQKHGKLYCLAYAGVFFVVGVLLFFLFLALRDGEFGFTFFILLFVLVGASALNHAFKLYRAYKHFGPTPLSLDPSQPSVGGQLAGRFSIDSSGINTTSDSDTQLQAKLTCAEKRINSGNTKKRIVWQEQAPVHLKQSASGVDASFLFVIPDSCTPSEELSQSASIEWNVSVKGELGSDDLSKFERDWQVVVGV